MTVNSRLGRAALAAGCLLSLAGFASANSGTQLPLSQYQAGTENATLVNNGNFESVTGSDPTVWTETEGMSTAAHVSGTNTNPAVFGNFAAQGFSTDLSEYSQPIAIDPAQSYVLSAYIWNFGNPGPAPHTPTDFDPGDQAVVELVGSGATRTLLLEPIALDGGSGSQGYFVYDTVPAGFFGTDTSVALDVRNDLDTAGPWPGVVTQFDNIGFTPASQFTPPTLVPEPATAATLLVAGAFAALRRRRR
jgi:hypothetical protein